MSRGWSNQGLHVAISGGLALAVGLPLALATSLPPFMVALATIPLPWLVVAWIEYYLQWPISENSDHPLDMTVHTLSWYVGAWVSGAVAWLF